MAKFFMWFLLICSLLSYLKLHEIFVFFKSLEELEADQRKVMKQITKCTKSFGKCTLEQTATLRAWSEKITFLLISIVSKYKRNLMRMRMIEMENVRAISFGQS